MRRRQELERSGGTENCQCHAARPRRVGVDFVLLREASLQLLSLYEGWLAALGVKGRARLLRCPKHGRRRADLNHHSCSSLILCVGTESELGLVDSVLLMVPSQY